MKSTITTIVVLLCVFFTGRVSADETKGVVVTIKPLHSLVSGVIGKSGEAKLLVTDNTSPHDFQLKPSQVKAMNEATLVLYIDDNFETFLNRALESLPKSVRKAAVGENAGLTLLSFREGGAWDSHGHDHGDELHGHEEKEKHNGHAKHGEHEKHAKHEEHEKHAKHEKEEHADGKHHHEEGEHDMHVWLDPANARKIVAFITQELSAVYPSNQSVYKANASKLIAKLDELDNELKQTLSGLKEKPFIVFHDAYQYFERAYGLRAVGSITFEPDESPSVNRIKEVRQKLQETKAKCVFREPQFSDRLINTIKDGTDAKIGTLDPLGADLKNDEKLYFSLMRNLAVNLKQCLAEVL